MGLDSASEGVLLVLEELKIHLGKTEQWKVPVSMKKEKKLGEIQRRDG